MSMFALANEHRSPSPVKGSVSPGAFGPDKDPDVLIEALGTAQDNTGTAYPAGRNDAVELKGDAVDSAAALTAQTSEPHISEGSDDAGVEEWREDFPFCVPVYVLAVVGVPLYNICKLVDWTARQVNAHRGLFLAGAAIVAGGLAYRLRGSR